MFDRIPTVLLLIALVGSAVAIHQYLDGLNHDEMIAADQENLARLDDTGRYQYLSYRAHESSPEAALQETRRDQERADFLQDVRAPHDLP